MRYPTTMKLATLTSTMMILSVFFLALPNAHAYGTAQWQIGFAGNFRIVGQPVNGGFWGWCAFSGSDGSSMVGTTGTSGDCQITNYFGKFAPIPTLNSPFHASFDGQWKINTGSAFCLGSPAIPCFFFRPDVGGTVEVTGPGAPAPVGVSIPLNSSTGSICAQILKPDGTPLFPSPPFSPLAGTPCDLGLPAIDGHFAFIGTMPNPDGTSTNVHIDINVTHLT